MRQRDGSEKSGGRARAVYGVRQWLLGVRQIADLVRRY